MPATAAIISPIVHRCARCIPYGSVRSSANCTLGHRRKAYFGAPEIESLISGKGRAVLRQYQMQIAEFMPQIAFTQGFRIGVP
jgi:hypothetical protein